MSFQVSSVLSSIHKITFQPSCAESRKIFNIGGRKLRVSVLETTKAAGPLAKQAQLVTAMQELKEKEIGCRWDAGMGPGWWAILRWMSCSCRTKASTKAVQRCGKWGVGWIWRIIRRLASGCQNWYISHSKQNCKAH